MKEIRKFRGKDVEVLFQELNGIYYCNIKLLLDNNMFYVGTNGSSKDSAFELACSLMLDNLETHASGFYVKSYEEEVQIAKNRVKTAKVKAQTAKWFLEFTSGNKHENIT